MIVAITGHRPQDCPREDIVRAALREALERSGAQTVIIGMAAGVDLWAGDEARKLGLELWCAKPWATHHPRKADRILSERLEAHANKIAIVTASDVYPGPWAYQKRNEWMVDHADSVIAYWSGKKSGGTFACVNYAKKVEKEVTNAYVK